MALQTQTILVDDIDGSRAAETIQFGFEGVEYEIDLNTENAKNFVEAMTPWVTSARRVGGRQRPGALRVNKKTSARTVRKWAMKLGLEVPDRGRIPFEIWERYEKEHADEAK
ncbi:MAG: Lsr2 family protein [Actinomycetaceae bacterium]|nr:Lsr2 family protein [Actinomycetaceae bacterium]